MVLASRDTGICAVSTLIDAAKRAGQFVWDLETTGLNPLEDRIEGIAFFVPATDTSAAVRAWFPFVTGTFIVSDDDGNISDLREPLDQRVTMEELRELFSLREIVAIAHNAKFDMAFMRHSSGADNPIEIENLLADSMIADYLSDERRRRYGLKIRVRQIFGHEMVTYAEAVRGQSTLNFMKQTPLGQYAMDDCQWTYELYLVGMASIRSQTPASRAVSTTPVEKTIGRPLGKLESIYWGIEMKLVRVLMEMETTGVLIDWRHLVDVETRLNVRRQILADRIEDFLGWPCNPRAVQQVVDALFSPPPDGLGLPLAGIPVGASGVPSTSDKVIKHFKRFHPLIQDILELRSIEVVLSGFVRKLRVLAQASFDGRIRSKFNQTGTVIGRLSSSDPVNMMNQPRDEDLVRRSFCAFFPTDPDPELVLIGGDYGQVELRVASHYAQEDAMREVYRMGAVCRADNGAACARFTFYECKACKECMPPILLDGELHCPKCQSRKIEHQERCRHVDLHQRTAEDAKVKRNPLAKCLDGSTLVRTVNGVRTIASLIPTTGAPGEHQPLRVCLTDGRGGYVYSSSAIFRHNRPTKIVVTKRAVVIATEDHRFQVIGDYDALDQSTPGYKHVPGFSLVEARSLEKGMKLPVALMGEEWRNQDHAWHDFSDPQSVRLNPFTKEIGDGPAEIILNEDWAYFAGMFHGDGCASGNACVITHGHTDEYEPWRQIVRSACDKLGLPTTLTADKRNTRIGSRIVRRYFAALGLCKEVGKSGQKTVRVPWWVLDGGPKIIWSYIAGLFDTDGTVGKRTGGTASFTTKYPEFAGQIAFLLRELGMPILVQPGFNKTYERWYYTVHVLGEGLDRFQRYCPMRDQDKQVRLTERNETIKRRCAPSDDEVLLVLDGGERTVYDFQVENDDHIYLQGGLLGHNNLNFGLLYRMAAPKFCVYADLFDADGKPMVSFASEVIQRWFATYPAIKVFHELNEETLPRNNWIATTLTGRMRRLDREAQINPYRAVTQGIQFQISGTAQDLIKIAMVRIFDERNAKIAAARPAERKLWEKFRFLIQVHDEIIFQSHKDIAAESAEIFERCMVTADGGALSVPLSCVVQIGRCWDDVH